jgi:hypothetical protein
LSHTLSHYPKVLLRAEPELMSLLLLVFVPHAIASLRAFFLPLLGLTFALLLLIYGDCRDGAPTHHPERPLLMFWLGAAVLAGALIENVWQHQRRALLFSAVLALSLYALRPAFTYRDSFVRRDAELEIGEIAREHARHGTLLIATHDFGYFAVMTGFGHPSRAVALREHDPRHPESDLFASPHSLKQAVSNKPADWLIVPREVAPHTPELGTVRASTAQFALVQLYPRER